MTNNCNCSDATVCEELPPVTVGSKLLVLNDANCQRTLVPTPGSLLYSDGVTVFYADGGAVAPLALPSLATYIQEEATTIPSILSKFAAGVIAAVTPAVATDGLVLTSLAGEWLLAPIPAQLCFSPDDVIVECCCPLSFAVWVLDDSDPDNIVLCLRQFNFCEDATNIESGSIMSCEPDTGCIRKLIGDQNDDVLIWNSVDQIWVPGQVSDLVPTPTSVVDTAFIQALNETTPVGQRGLGFTFGSLSILGQSDIMVDISAGNLRTLNAGWYKFDFRASGWLRSDVPLIDGDPVEDNVIVSFIIKKNGVTQNGNINDVGPISIRSAETATFETSVVYGVSGSQSFLCAVNDVITFEVSSTAIGSDCTSFYDMVWDTVAGGLSCVTHRLNGTITRIT